MIYGKVVHEHILFNEETLWTGKPHDYFPKDTYKYLTTSIKLRTRNMMLLKRLILKIIKQ